MERHQLQSLRGEVAPEHERKFRRYVARAHCVGTEHRGGRPTRILLLWCCVVKVGSMECVRLPLPDDAVITAKVKAAILSERTLKSAEINVGAL
jgi:hypothetical protein